MNNFKATKIKRATAFLMSLIVSFTALVSDASLLKAYAQGTDSSVTSSVTNEGNTDVAVTKNAVIDGEGNVTITFDVENLTTTQEVETSTAAEIIFLMDTSGTMSGSLSGDKLPTAKAAAKNFAKAIFDANKGDNIKVGVIAFNDSATSTTLKDNYDDVESMIDNLPVGVQTNIQMGIHAARESFSNNDCTKILVILTDGEPTASYKGTGVTLDKIVLNAKDDEGVSEKYLLSKFDYTQKLGGSGEYKLNSSWYTKEEWSWFDNDGNLVDAQYVACPSNSIDNTSKAVDTRYYFDSKISGLKEKYIYMDGVIKTYKKNISMKK